MANINSAATTTSVLSQAIKNRYYDELFLRTAEATLVHQQLGQLNRQIPKGENSAAVFWTRWLNLPLVTAGQGEGVPTTASAASAVNVTGTNAQYDAAISISDLTAMQSFGDVMKSAMRLLAYNAGLSIDTVVRNAVVNSGIGQLAGGTAGTQAAWTSVPSTAIFTIGELRKAIRTLQKNNAFTVGTNTNAALEPQQGYWIAVVSPDTAYDVMGDTATGAWIDSNRYAGSERIFSGEIGKLYGTRFIRTSNAYSYGTANTANSAFVHATLVTGSDYFGVTTLQNLQTFIKDFGSGGIADPTNKIATAGWKCTFGSTVLNSAFAVTVANAVTP